MLLRQVAQPPAAGFSLPPPIAAPTNPGRRHALTLLLPFPYPRWLLIPGKTVRAEPKPCNGTQVVLVRSRDCEFLPAAHSQNIFAGNPRLNFLDKVGIDQHGPVDANKGVRL